MSVYRVGSNKSSINNFPNVRPSLDLDFANTKTLDPRITFTRSSGGSYVGADGLIKYAGVNEARFDHNPVTGESLGLLVEESRTNDLLYSEDFSNAYWTKINVSIISNAATAPNGSSNASKLVESESTSLHEVSRGSDGNLVVLTDTYITFSIFAKAAERKYCYIRSVGSSKRIAVVVDLSNGTFNVTNWGFTLNSSATVTPYPNGWYRITATAQSNYPDSPGWGGFFVVSSLDSYQLASSVAGSGYSYPGDGTSGIYIWGAHY